MSDRDGRKQFAPGRLATVISAAIVAVALLFAVPWFTSLQLQREAIQQEASCKATKAKPCSDKGNLSDIRASSAAQDSVDIAFAQAILGVAGLIGLTFTVLYARGAWLAGEAAAEAADKTLAATRDGERRQLRAYMAVQSASVMSPRDPAKRKVRIKVENYGQTPALEVSTWRTAFMGPYPYDGRVVKPPKGVLMGRDVRPPHVAYEAELALPIRLSSRDARDILLGVKAFWVIGEVRYVDIFGDPHLTTYRLYSNGALFREGALRADESGNDMT